MEKNLYLLNNILINDLLNKINQKIKIKFFIELFLIEPKNEKLILNYFL